ncbi:hypothetical protein TPHA_0P00200 [Tetrapisispora phaffii CBS 4417]|uniref:rRNA-processing protein FYV7 n=1 Tax=Tetrapisispora phaffii (strain ATCC 24235 / CBS 4417 / NBRC 1672 / NRRL Y-8282 / UCD 70-5) TaxID=1071381 RepID=G8C200_TETPH|nr:hypothetical protein TPHA_0P00200 [Tetrapisispora phaffii CBS 4417]CCE66178.1 hypothetical protein TPHA_0P00200 [Tetrapisispora phaffii CBS 4417]
MVTSKQQYNKKKFTREYKVKEIQKNLTKKARLKKEYLKALKEEGYAVPEKAPSEGNEKYDYKKRKEEREQENRRRALERKAMKQEKKWKEKQRTLQRQQTQEERTKTIQLKLKDRERRRERLTQMTRSGQPKMGPKIEDLLNKIKTDDTYTG